MFQLHDLIQGGLYKLWILFKVASNNFYTLRYNFFGFYMYASVCLHARTSSYKLYEQHTAVLTAYTYFSLRYLNECPKPPPQQRGGYFPTYVFFTLLALINLLLTNILQHPVLSAFLHLSHIWLCMCLHWSQIALNKDEKWGKSISANRMANLVRRT